MQPGQVDTVIVATVSHLLQTPSAATAIAHELGTTGAAFDISAACAGFCHGLALASDLVRAGSSRHVLVIGVERLSDITSSTDRGTAFIFSDGAGATISTPLQRTDGVLRGPTTPVTAWAVPAPPTTSAILLNATTASVRRIENMAPPLHTSRTSRLVRSW